MYKKRFKTAFESEKKVEKIRKKLIHIHENIYMEIFQNVDSPVIFADLRKYFFPDCQPNPVPTKKGICLTMEQLLAFYNKIHFIIGKFNYLWMNFN